MQTKIGPTTVGWWKRVISIDWSETVCKIGGDELFPGEAVTKGSWYIHAWKVEDGRRYVKAIIDSMGQ